MSKTLDRMRNNPRDDWRIGQLRRVAERAGLTVRQARGSHVAFDHPSLERPLIIPVHRPILPVYVRRLVQIIDNLPDEENEDDPQTN